MVSRPITQTCLCFSIYPLASILAVDKCTDAVIETKDRCILIAIQSVCSKQNIPIPWDDIGSVLEDKPTGSAITQHLVKLRAFLKSKDIVLPPSPRRGGMPRSTPKKSSLTSPFKITKSGKKRVKTPGGESSEDTSDGEYGKPRVKRPKSSRTSKKTSNEVAEEEEDDDNNNKDNIDNEASEIKAEGYVGADASFTRFEGADSDNEETISLKESDNGKTNAVSEANTRAKEEKVVQENAPKDIANPDTTKMLTLHLQPSALSNVEASSVQHSAGNSEYLSNELNTPIPNWDSRMSYFSGNNNMTAINSNGYSGYNGGQSGGYNGNMNGAGNFNGYSQQNFAQCPMSYGSNFGLMSHSQPSMQSNMYFQGSTGTQGNPVFQNNSSFQGNMGIHGNGGLQGNSGSQWSAGLQGTMPFQGNGGLQSNVGAQGNAGLQSNTNMLGHVNGGYNWNLGMNNQPRNGNMNGNWSMDGAANFNMMNNQPINSSQLMGGGAVGSMNPNQMVPWMANSPWQSSNSVGLPMSNQSASASVGPSPLTDSQGLGMPVTPAVPNQQNLLGPGNASITNSGPSTNAIATPPNLPLMTPLDENILNEIPPPLDSFDEDFANFTNIGQLSNDNSAM